MPLDPRMTDEARYRSAAGQSEQTARPEPKPRFELSLTRVMAGALAAASAAVAASWLGVAGTVFGAVLASIVVSVSSALYMKPIEHSKRVIRETLPILPVLPERYRHLYDEAAASPETMVLSASADSTDVGLYDAGHTGDRDAPQAGPRAPAREQRRLNLGAVAATAALTLVAGFGILTGVEALLGQSVSSLTGSDSKHGTTFGELTRNSPDVTPPAGTAPAKPGDTVSEPTDTTPSEPTETTPSEPTETTPSEPTDTTPSEPTDTMPTRTKPPVTTSGDGQTTG